MMQNTAPTNGQGVAVVRTEFEDSQDVQRREQMQKNGDKEATKRQEAKWKKAAPTAPSRRDGEGASSSLSVIIAHSLLPLTSLNLEQRRPLAGDSIYSRRQNQSKRRSSRFPRADWPSGQGMGVPDAAAVRADWTATVRSGAPYQ